MRPLRREVMPHRPVVGAVLAVWVAAVIGGMGAGLYDKATLDAGEDARAWPAESQLVRANGLPTLVMFAHPNGPHTHASLTELATFVAEARGRVAAQVVFARPADVDGDWVHTESWAQAMAIPGVLVSIDTDGGEGRRFGARTSGDVMLYATDGRRLFSGAITSAHRTVSSNLGLDRVEALLAAPR